MTIISVKYNEDEFKASAVISSDMHPLVVAYMFQEFVERKTGNPYKLEEFNLDQNLRSYGLETFNGTYCRFEIHFDRKIKANSEINVLADDTDKSKTLLKDFSEASKYGDFDI